MLNAIGVLTVARLRIFKNTLWRGTAGRKIGFAALLLLGLLAAWGTNALMRGAVDLLTSERFLETLREAAERSPELALPTDFRPFLAALPSMALFGALLALIFTGFSSVLSSLYLSGDLDMLVVAPVPMRAVFIVKLFGGLVAPYVLLLVLFGPALTGYGQSLGYGPAYYAALALTVLLFPLLPVSLGALLVMAVVRVIPARRARDIVSVLGGLLGVGWYVLSQFSPQIAPRLANVQTLDDLRALDVPLLPSAWAGRALVAAGEGQWVTLAAYGGLFAAASLGVFLGSVALAERLYYVGWSNVAASGGGRKKAPERRQKDDVRQPIYLAPFTILLPPESAAIATKDLRVFPRDLRSLQQVIFPLALAGIWTFQLVGSGSGTFDGSVGSVGRLIGPAGIAFFVCLSLSNALGGPSVSREGRGFWLLKVAPVSAYRLLLGKLAVAYLPFPTAGTLFVAALVLLQGGGLGEFVAALALVLVTGLGSSAITLGMGAAFPRFDWESPQQQTTLQTGCLSPVLYLGYLGLAVGVALGLPALGLLLPEYAALLTAAGWGLLIALTAGVTWGALAVGSARLERVEI